MQENLARFTVALTADGSLTAFDARAGEAFKSRHAAATESEKVFIEPGFRHHPLRETAGPFRILELGLGLATNLRALVACLRELPEPAALEYEGIERDTAGLAYMRAHDPALGESWLMELLAKGASSPQAAVSLRLHACEFLPALERLTETASGSFHTIFFDPFSPKANPDAWTDPYFRLAFRLLVPGGRLVTYSVSRVAKDGLASAGFWIEKRRLPQILRKREGLIATKPAEAACLA